MPKMKTKRAAEKRFSSTGSGKIKRRRGGLRHNLGKRSTKSKTIAGTTDYVHAADESRIRKMLPYL
ncbi:50S ribosomal protein L35 [Bacteriovoracales bacterium]|nr:50S ribosomal protein L35 [Bacteriovoracales bacterium]|tara:strand:- start:248 stop:445 length:198 start_codon:yes stop_codon:yes gene_type:complete